MPQTCKQLNNVHGKNNGTSKSTPENYRLHKLEAVKNEGQSNMIPGHVRASINWNNSNKQTATTIV